MYYIMACQDFRSKYDLAFNSRHGWMEVIQVNNKVESRHATDTKILESLSSGPRERGEIRRIGLQG